MRAKPTTGEGREWGMNWELEDKWQRYREGITFRERGAAVRSEAKE